MDGARPRWCVHCIKVDDNGMIEEWLNVTGYGPEEATEADLRTTVKAAYPALIIMGVEDW